MLQGTTVNLQEGGETMFGENHFPQPFCVLGDEGNYLKIIWLIKFLKYFYYITFLISIYHKQKSHRTDFQNLNQVLKSA